MKYSRVKWILNIVALSYVNRNKHLSCSSTPRAACNTTVWFTDNTYWSNALSLSHLLEQFWFYTVFNVISNPSDDDAYVCPKTKALEKHQNDGCFTSALHQWECFLASPPQISELTCLASLIDIHSGRSARVSMNWHQTAYPNQFLYVDMNKTAERISTVMMVSRCKMFSLHLSGRRQDMFIPDKQI